MSNVSGSVRVRASGGGIDIDKLDGDLKGNASGGSINIREASGNVDVACSGGGIRADRITGMVNASSSGGGVSARFVGRPKGDCRLSSSGGDVVVFLPDEAGFSLDSEVRGGHVETEFPLSAVIAASKHTLKGDVNGGGPKLLCKASGGNVILKKLSMNSF